ncbi:phosphopantetheine-binding protein, partial [Oxalobacteraceae bacterium A2-2]
HQIKLRGMRIEAGEVEAQLRRLPGVKQAVVAVSGTRLAAYLVVQETPPDQRSWADACREPLREFLPDYMVPELYVPLTRLPLTRTGKVDRRALPDPAPLRKAAYVAPRSDTEAALCQLWQDVLKAGRIGVEDNFFASGGDSITSMLLVARARQQGLPFTVRELFQHQTIAALSTQVLAPRQGGCGAALPISGAQAYLLERSSHACGLMQSHAIALPRRLRQDELDAMAAALYRRHDALRMSPAGGTVRFEAADSPPPSAASAQADGDPLRAHYDAIVVRRSAAFRLSQPAGQPVLLVSMHRLACDARSWLQLEADIQTLLACAEAGVRPDLGRGASYAGWLRSVPAADGARALAPEDGVPPFGRGTARLASAWIGFDGDALNKAYRTSTTELLLAALAGLRQEQGDGAPLHLVVGCDARADGQGTDYGATVGCFLALRRLTLALPGEAAFESLIAHVKRRQREAAPLAAGRDSEDAVRFDLAQAQGPCPERMPPAAPLLRGEAQAIEHLVCGDRIHITIQAAAGEDGPDPAILLARYIDHINRIAALCKEELQLQATREHYAHTISFNEADLDMYGEEF